MAVVTGTLAMACAERGCTTRARADERALDAAVLRAKREAVVRVLAQTRGNVAAAAAVLGILRTSLYRIMKRYGIATNGRIQPKD